MWPLKIALDAVRGLLGSFGGFLSIAGIVVAIAGGIYFAGYTDGRSSDRVAQLEAQIAAEKDRARREAALAKRLEREKSDLETALEKINDTTPIDAAGDACPLSADYRLRLTEAYSD